MRQSAPIRDPMTMVWMYVDASKEVGDVDHLKVFATPELCQAERSEGALLLNMRSSVEAGGGG